MRFRNYILACTLYAPMLWSNPDGPSVTHGHATFQTSHKTLQVNTGERTIIDWNQFSIARDEAVHFVQKNSTSAVLNRVTGGEISHLQGHLNSNGQVFLLNPKGILIGKEGVINTEGFVASTLNLTNEQFLQNGPYQFGGESSASIINEGTLISATGDIFLIAATIKNEGIISAPQGSIGMAQGKELLLMPQDNEHFLIQCPIEEEGTIDNSGTLDGATIEIRASTNPYSLAIKQSGTIHAQGIEQKNGRIYLVADSGKVVVSGEQTAPEGEIHVLGDHIHLEENAQLNVLGEKGGEILIGGDYQGSSPHIKNAQTVEVHEGASLYADGLNSDAGRIIIWSDGSTRCAGTLSAAALGPEGDGGFIEISGKENLYLDETCHPTLHSSSGKLGTLLLDPGKVNIASGGGASGPNTFSDNYINSQLALPSNVTISTASATGGQEIIEFDGSVNINWATSAELEFIAGRNIDQAGNITSTGDGNLIMTALGTVSGDYVGITVSGVISNDAGGITLNGIGGDGNGRSVGVEVEDTLITSDGFIDIHGIARGDGQLKHGIVMRGLIHSTVSGDIDLRGIGSTGDVSLADGIYMPQGTIVSDGSGNITCIGVQNSPLATGQRITGVEVQPSTQINATGSGSITIDGTVQAQGFSNQGVYVHNSSRISSSSGAISVTGHIKGAGESNVGIYILNNASIESDSGDIEVIGESLNGLDNSPGVLVGQNGLIHSNLGAVTVEGTSTTGTGSTQRGVEVTGAGSRISAFGAGDVTITGHGSGLSNGYGVLVHDSGLAIAGGSGNINVTGTAGGNDGSNYGVLVTDSGSQIGSNGGNTILNGTGSPDGGIHNVGVFITNQGEVNSGTGALFLTGIGGVGDTSHGIEFDSSGVIMHPGGLTVNGTSTDGNNSIGVLVPSSISLDTTGTGNIAITGESTGTGGACDGVLIDGTVEATGNGDITISGTTTTADSTGVHLDGGTLSAPGGMIDVVGTSNTPLGGNNLGCQIGNNTNVTARDGVSIAGTGGLGTSDYNDGVEVINSTVTTQEGVLSIIGQGRGDPSTDFSRGCVMTNSQITATGNGSITLEGTGGSGQIAGSGFNLTSSSVQTQGSGSISITGEGGTGSISPCHGLTIFAGSTVEASGSGDVALSGTGGVNASQLAGGVILEDGSSVLTQSGSIDITGNSNSGSDSSAVEILGVIDSTQGGNVSITGNAGAVNTGSHGVEIRGTSVTTTDGTITIVGEGIGTNGVVNNIRGIEVRNSQLTATGNGSISLNGIGGAAASSIGGVWVRNNSLIETQGTGSIDITGQGGTGNGNFGYGVNINLGANVIQATGTGDISITGTGGVNTNQDASGVNLVSGSSILTQSGSINISGNASSGSESSGVDIEGTVTANGAGNISITGGSTSPSEDCYGVLVDNNIKAQGTGSITINGTTVGGTEGAGTLINSGVEVTAVSGDISITGVSNGSMNQSDGVRVIGTVSTGSMGSIQITGDASANGTLANDGIEIRGGNISTVDGSIDIMGTTLGFGNLPSGIELKNSATIVATGSGAITLNGTGSVNGVNSSDGVQLQSGSTIATVDGDLTITGTTGGTGEDCFGFVLRTGSTLTSTGVGNISITGTGSSSGTNDCVGISISEAVTASGGGNIELTGQGGAGVNGYGVHIFDGVTVSTSNNGSVDITGTAGLGSGDNYGVFITSNGTGVVTDSGSLSVTGAGGGGSGSHNVGVYISNNSLVSSNSGVVSLSGTGGSGSTLNHGLEVISSNTILSPGGLILEGTATSGTSSRGVLIPAGVVLETSGNNPLSITGSSNAGSSSPGVEIAGIVQIPGNGDITISGVGSTSLSEGILLISGSSVTSNGGDIALSGTGQMGALSALAVENSTITTTGSGNIEIETLGHGDLSDGGVGGSSYITETGDVTLSSDGAIRFSGSSLSSISGTTGSITLEANGSDILLGNSAAVTTTGGGATLNAARHIELGVINVTNSGSITIDAGGVVSDSTGLLSSKLIGNSAVIHSGQTSSLHTTLNELTTTTTNSGFGDQSINITNSQDLELLSAQADSIGAITIEADGLLTVTGSIITGGGSANLTAANDLTLGAVSVGSGDIVLSSGGAVSDSGSSLVGNRAYIESSGTINIGSTLDAIQASGNGNITLTNDQALTIIDWYTTGIGIEAIGGSGTIDVTTTAGDITVLKGVENASGSIYFNASGAAVINDSIQALADEIQITGSSVAHNLTGSLQSGADITVTATAGNVTMSPTVSYTTSGGNATILANNSIHLSEVNVGTGTILVEATNGGITNNSGTQVPPILIGAQANLTAANGIGAGLSNSPTAIGTHIDTLDATVTGIGDIIIYEESGLTLGDIIAANGTLDVDAGGLIEQSGNPNLNVTHAVFTTSRDNAIGTAEVVNGGDLVLGMSIVAGDLSLDMGTNTLELGGNSEVGLDFDVTSGAYTPGSFTMAVGGSVSTPPPGGGLNTVIASGNGSNFDLSQVTLSTSGDITVNLRGGFYTSNGTESASALLLNSSNNNITGTLSVTTVDPNVVLNPQDYNLETTQPLTLNPGQNLIINAARGANFSSLGNPDDSPFGGSTLNGGNGSNIALGNNSTFGGWVSIRDPFDAEVESGSQLALEYVNTYGNLTLTTTAGGINTGEQNKTVTVRGTNAILTSSGDITLGGDVSAPSALLKYTSSGGSILGGALSTGNEIQIDMGGGVGTLGQYLQLDTGLASFNSQSDSFMNFAGASTLSGNVQAGDVTITTSNPGVLTLDGAPIQGQNINVSTNDGAIHINRGIAASGGSITVSANGDVTHNGPDNFTASSSITVEALNGSISMANATAYSTPGDISLTATDNIVLQRINSGSGDIRIEATNGTVTQNTVGPNLSGDKVYIKSALGIGTSAISIQGDLEQFQGVVTGVGDIYMRSLDSVELNNWNVGSESVQTVDGRIEVISAGGNITITNPISAGGMGSINIHAHSGAVSIQDSIESANGSIDISADHMITHADQGDVRILNGTSPVTETVQLGPVMMGALSVVSTTGGNITLSASDQIALGTLDASMGNIYIRGGSITDNTGGSGVNLSGANGYCQVLSSLGGNGAPIRTALTQFQGEVTGTGDLYIFETAGDLNLDDWNLSGNSVMTNNGHIDIQVAGGDLTVSRPVRAGGSGLVNLGAQTGNISATQLIRADGGKVRLIANLNIELRQINANSGDIQLISNAGSIIQSGGGVSLIGERGYCYSLSGIGTQALPMEVNLDHFQGNVIGAGDIHVAADGSLNLSAWNSGLYSAQTINGEIHVEATGGDLSSLNVISAGGVGSVNLDASAGNILLSGNSVLITNGGDATLSADLNIELGTIDVKSGDIRLTSSTGTITQVGAGVSLIGERAYCQSASGIGMNGTPIETTLSQFEGDVTGPGDIYLRETESLELTNWNLGPNSVQAMSGTLGITVDNGDLEISAPTATSGNLAFTATNGAIINASSVGTPPILIGDQATLVADSGVGAGSSSSSTAIGTDLNTLIATVTGIGDVVIYEETGLTLGNISVANGNLDINAGGLIEQIGNPNLNVTHVSFTTNRHNTIGTVEVVHQGDLLLGTSKIAGNLSLDVGTNAVQLGGNSEVGIDFDITSGTYTPTSFSVAVGGTTSTPPPAGGLNTIVASGNGTTFDLSQGDMATTGDITVNLRGGFYSANGAQSSGALLLNSSNNTIGGTLTITTIDPNLAFSAQDYNLENTQPITLNSGQNLIINAARGANFSPIGNPDDSPFGGSTLNSNNGSNIVLGNNSTFGGGVSIRDPFNAEIDGVSALELDYTNTYGDCSIITANGDLTVSESVTANNVGTIHLESSNGSILMSGATEVATQGGNINLLAQNDLHVGKVSTDILGAQGTITATAQNGAIIDAAAVPNLPNFQANALILEAASGIGTGLPSPPSTTDIGTTVNMLTASTTTNNIFISNTGGLTLQDIQAGGDFYLEAGGLVTQAGGTALLIGGDLSIETSRAGSLGTVEISNTAPTTTLKLSMIAGDYTVNTNGAIALQGDQFVGLQCDLNQNPTLGGITDNGYQLFHGGLYFVNGVDPDLQEPTINATGPTPDFDIALALPLSNDPVITVNLQGSIDSFANPQVPPAILLTEGGNTINGAITITTVDPQYGGSVIQDYNLIQTTPFILDQGQTLKINGVGTTLNGGLGSNVTLSLPNQINGTITATDVNLCTIEATTGDPLFGPMNTRGELTLTATSGVLTINQPVLSNGDFVTLQGDGGIQIDAGVRALDSSNLPFGEIIYTTSSGSITGGGVSEAKGVSFLAPGGSITVHTQTPACIFSSQNGADITNNLVGARFGGSVSGGPLSLTQMGSGDMHVDTVTVSGTTFMGLSAIDQPIQLINHGGAIIQIGGNVDAGSLGTVTLQSATGISGTAPGNAFETLAFEVYATNTSLNDLRIENRLNGSNALTTNVTLSNMSAVGDLYYSQVGGSSVNFQSTQCNGTATLLATEGSSNMRFSGNVNVGRDMIAVANHNMDIEMITLNLGGVATLVLDQESPAVPGSGEFTNAGLFNIPSDNLAIYAASGPLPPANPTDVPPNQVSLGLLASIETWDQSLPQGLDTKYHTSYSNGGSYHGAGFGTSYIPGNGVFGSRVIWYKFDVDQIAGKNPPTTLFFSQIGINAWVDSKYFLNQWFSGPFCSGKSRLLDSRCNSKCVKQKRLLNSSKKHSL